MSAEKSARRNDEIIATRVRLIGANGEQIGVISLREALKGAEEVNLDLVEIQPNAEPPVCRIMDYGKYLFEQSKQKIAAKKRQKQVQVKEVKFRPSTEKGDYEVKLRNLIRFLKQGDKAKVTLRFRGREMIHQELGVKLLEKLQVDLSEFGVVEQFPKLEGRQMVMIFAPKKK